MLSAILGSLIVCYLILVVMEFRQYKKNKETWMRFDEAVVRQNVINQRQLEIIDTFNRDSNELLDQSWSNVIQLSEERRRLRQKELECDRLIEKKSNKRKKKIRGKHRKA